MRLADYLVETVADHADTVYLVTGRGALFLTDAVAKSKRLRPVCTHHEQAAAYAATARAQLHNTLGVCLVSTGCASTNAVTGVLNAYQDGLPVLFISGQNVLKETTYYTGHPIRTYGQQEANIVEIVKPITKYAVTITDPRTIRQHLEQALYLANEGKKGPVWIDIPLDLQSAQIEPDELPGFDAAAAPTNAPDADIAYLREAIGAAERPVLLIGSGLRSANVLEPFADFVQANRIPVVYTPSSADCYPLSQELSVGSLGSMGCSRAGAFAVQNADCVIVLGNRLSSITTGVDFCKFAREAKLIVVDLDEAEHRKNELRVDRIVVQDLATLFGRLGSERLSGDTSAWVEKCLHWKTRFAREPYFASTERVDLYDLTHALSSTLDIDAIVITDSGLIEVILPSNLDFGARRRAIHPVSQGAMGFALPAVLGVGDQDRQVVVVVGDGSFMMNMQELETIRAHGIPVKLIVVNNNVYSIIRRRQKELFRNRTIGTDPGNGVTVPEFEKVAGLFGFGYVRIDGIDGLQAGLAQVMRMDGPVLCEIMGKEDQEYVEVSHAKNSAGKFVRRPLEDQWPFLERDVFTQEMIVEAIDQ
ncbi:thiamine pyrophosphate-binding protein [Massilia sp. 9I]|uniref:thiamine pyrophosphate-binding protein n=1 Tax=Massilia sp. 9I TaxID=2653152 RepID=UPI0012F3B871|nr:thiamine pyrophosphate-binding protein [Massilia sp. 9I]VXC75901.1 putative TPP-requiring enzyme co-localized with O-antigen rfb gene cluster [Massilia sp. 9I]